MLVMCDEDKSVHVIVAYQAATAAAKRGGLVDQEKKDKIRGLVDDVKQF